MSEEPLDARERAMLALYQAELRSDPGLARLPEGRMKRLVTGVVSGQADLDAELDAVSERWPTRRMPVVDRVVLRVALYELHHEVETPAAVVLAEAVRIAKKYSTHRSGAFVNGLLATLAARLRPDEVAASET